MISEAIGDRVPTVLRWRAFRYYFYSHEPNEPPHVHVDRGSDSAKFWLDPVGLARNIGFNAVDLNRLQRVVVENRAELLREWHGYLGSQRR